MIIIRLHISDLVELSPIFGVNIKLLVIYALLL